MHKRGAFAVQFWYEGIYWHVVGDWDPPRKPTETDDGAGEVMIEGMEPYHLERDVERLLNDTTIDEIYARTERELMRG